MTDIGRDKKLKQKDIKISFLEKKFRKTPSPKLAKEIIDELNELKNMPRGYLKLVYTQKIKDNIEKYRKYLVENK